MLREPGAWIIAARRTNDVAFQVAGELETVTVNGYVGNLEALKEPYATSLGDQLAVDLEHDGGQVVSTLIARLGNESFGYYLWLELFANRDFTGPPGPAVLLHAFDPLSAQDTSTPTATVAAWALSDP